MSIRQLTTAATWTGDEVRVAANVAAHAARALRDIGDDRGADAADRSRHALAAPEVTLVVAGEYQKGKSSLINGLLGARVTPTEPLATTSAPIRISWSDETTWHVHLASADEGSGFGRVAIHVEQFDRLASTDRPELDGRAVLGFEVTIDHPLLRSGISLVDTPSVSGGMSTPTAGAVLGLLQGADGLVFVTDASQELSAPEVEFLRMARTLCPALLVAMSKVDLHPEWRRILDIDQDHLTEVDPDAVVLPVSPYLRAAAVRWGDADLDRESGLQLVTWYLATTMAARTRQAAVARCGSEVANRLAAAVAVMENRLAALERSTGRRETEEKYQRVSERAERLRTEAPKRVRLELRSFAQATRTDLTNRFAGVNEVIAELIKNLDPAEQWPEMEASLHRAANRALVDHMITARSRAEDIVDGLVEMIGLDQGRLVVELEEVATTPTLVPDIEQPNFSTGGAARIHDLARGSVLTGSMGFGLATIVTGGLAALALGAGASLSTAVFTLRRERSRDIEGRRSQALQACRAWVADARAAVSTYADDVYKELEFQLETQIEKGLQSLLADSETERARLEQLSRVAAELVPEEVSRAKEQLERLQLVHAHARRLQHRLRRPELQVAAR